MYIVDSHIQHIVHSSADRIYLHNRQCAVSSQRRNSTRILQQNEKVLCDRPVHQAVLGSNVNKLSYFQDTFDDNRQLCALLCACVFDPIYSGASLRLSVYV